MSIAFKTNIAACGSEYESDSDIDWLLKPVNRSIFNISHIPNLFKKAKIISIQGILH